MKVRIIKTSEGYIPQVYKVRYTEPRWFSLSSTQGDYVHEWSDPDHIFEHATHWTK
jgi:hypothetical protein